MQRLLLRIALLSLCAGTVSGCSLFGADTNAMTMPSGKGQSTLAMAADVNAAVRQAQGLRAKGDTEGATRILSQLMLAAPDDAGVVGEYGKLLLQESRPDDAVQFLQRAVQLQPNDWSLYSAMGVAYDQLNNHTNAKLAYERALSLKPGEPAVLNNFAMSRMLAGDTVQARALMVQAKASGSTDPKIASNLELLDSMAPAKPAAPAPQAVVVTAPAHQAAVSATPALRTALTSPPASPNLAAAHHAPAPITHKDSQVVMQEVPVDKLAGPVRKVHPAKLAKATKVGHAPQPLTVATVKPATSTAANHIPELRMTADASKP